MEIIDKIIKSPTQPKSTNLLWLDSKNNILKTFDGKWRALTSSPSNGGSSSSPGTGGNTAINISGGGLVNENIGSMQQLMTSENLNGNMVQSIQVTSYPCLAKYAYPNIVYNCFILTPTLFPVLQYKISKSGKQVLIDTTKVGPFISAEARTVAYAIKQSTDTGYSFFVEFEDGNIVEFKTTKNLELYGYSTLVYGVKYAEMNLEGMLYLTKEELLKQQQQDDPDMPYDELVQIVDMLFEMLHTPIKVYEGDYLILNFPTGLTKEQLILDDISAYAPNYLSNMFQLWKYENGYYTCASVDTGGDMNNEYGGRYKLINYDIVTENSEDGYIKRSILPLQLLEEVDSKQTIIVWDKIPSYIEVEENQEYSFYFNSNNSIAFSKEYPVLTTDVVINRQSANTALFTGVANKLQGNILHVYNITNQTPNN